MTLREIFRFELSYQLRRVSTWLFFVILLVVAYNSIQGNYIDDARNGDFLLHAPWVIAMVTVLGSQLAWLMAAFMAGDAATRDVRTGMDPLTYTTPISKSAFLGGRFLAAFVLNALILLALPIGILLGTYVPGVETNILGPLRPAAYVNAYVILALPNAFIGAAIQFSLATLSRRAIASYVGSVLLVVFVCRMLGPLLAVGLGWWTPALLVDPTGLFFVSQLLKVQTSSQTNAHLIGLDGILLVNRAVWLGIAVGALAFTRSRFRLAHETTSGGWRWFGRRRRAGATVADGAETAQRLPISVPAVRRTFGVATHLRQTLAIASRSLRTIVLSRIGLVLLTAIAVLGGAYMVGHMTFMGVPLIPKTDLLLTFLTAPLTVVRTGWVIIPLLTIFYAGEVVWRERDAGLSEITDAAPVPDWVLFLGRFLGLGLVLVAWMALLLVAGVLVQAGLGYYHFEIGLYLQALFGLQLTEYLFFALLVLVIHGLVGDKNLGYLLSLLAFGGIAFASTVGIHHHLLVYGTSPEWTYTDMRGFGASLGPWLWFKSYWAAWALLLAVVACLLWMRGKESRLRLRFQVARGRLTRPTAIVAIGSIGMILILGGFIFYNTNVLNAYTTASDRLEQRADYERRYGVYEDASQPRLNSVDLHAEIYPGRRAAVINGTYHLVNTTPMPIDSVHLSTVPDVETGAVSFDRAATRVLDDEELGYQIYTLSEALQPGDSLQLSFKVHTAPHGFRNTGIDAAVAANGTYFWNYEWLPAVGYQPNREIRSAGARRAHGLAPHPVLAPLNDQAEQVHNVRNRINLDITVGTSAEQIAIAPGTLRRTWTEGDRCYRHYVTDVPIGNEYAFYSADYAVHEAQWTDSLSSTERPVAIQIFHDPRHTTNLARMVRSVQASLRRYTEEFGPYPYDHIRIVEHPGLSYGMHAEANTIDCEEGFSLLNPDDGPRGLDLPFYVVAHEVAHQWWGDQLTPAPVEGAGLLVESLASYSAYQVMEATYGISHLRRLFAQLRKSYEEPRTRAAPPLIRVTDAFQYYRRGPFSLYALSAYIGVERVNDALRLLLTAHASPGTPLATTRDLDRELRMVTPDSLQYLLHDLFEANTWWELKTERATATQSATGEWEVILDVQARKVVVDSAGAETDVPMDDWIEVGVSAAGNDSSEQGAPLDVRMHRIHSGTQTITLTVPHKPARAGIDPYHLLDWTRRDGIVKVRIANDASAG